MPATNNVETNPRGMASLKRYLAIIPFLLPQIWTNSYKQLWMLQQRQPLQLQPGLADSMLRYDFGTRDSDDTVSKITLIVAVRPASLADRVSGFKLTQKSRPVQEGKRLRSSGAKGLDID